MAVFDDNNPLSALLKQGVSAGGQWASGKLFGSSNASQQDMELERARNNSINGNGPVNQSAALNRPGSWTEFFFGAPANTGGAKVANGRPPPLGLILLGVAIAAWFIWKKA